MQDDFKITIWCKYCVRMVLVYIPFWSMRTCMFLSSCSQQRLELYKRIKMFSETVSTYHFMWIYYVPILLYGITSDLKVFTIAIVFFLEVQNRSKVYYTLTVRSIVLVKENIPSKLHAYRYFRFHVHATERQCTLAPLARVWLASVSLLSVNVTVKLLKRVLEDLISLY